MKVKITKVYIAAFFTQFLSAFPSFFFFAIINLCQCGSAQTFTTIQTEFVDLHC